MIRPYLSVSEGLPSEVIVVENFLEELKRRVPN